MDKVEWENVDDEVAHKVRKFNKDGKPSKAECFVWRNISTEIKKAENK